MTQEAIKQSGVGIIVVFLAIAGISSMVGAEGLSITSVDIQPIGLYSKDGSICVHIIRDGGTFTEGMLNVVFREDDGWTDSINNVVGFDQSEGCYYLELDQNSVDTTGNYTLGLSISVGDPLNLTPGAYESAGKDIEIPVLCGCNNESWCNPECPCDLDCLAAQEMGAYDFFGCIDLAQFLGYSPHPPSYTFSNFGEGDYINPFTAPHSIFLGGNSESSGNKNWDECEIMFNSLGWSAGMSKQISGKNVFVEVERGLISVGSEECENIIKELKERGAEMVYVSNPGLSYLCSNIRQDNDPTLSERDARQIFNSALGAQEITIVKLVIVRSQSELEYECPGIMAPAKIIEDSQGIPVLSTDNGLMGLAAVFSAKYDTNKVCWVALDSRAALGALGDHFSFELDTNFDYADASSIALDGKAIVYGDVDYNSLNLDLPVFLPGDFEVDSRQMAEGTKLFIVGVMDRLREFSDEFQETFNDAIASCEYGFKETDANDVKVCDNGKEDDFTDSGIVYLLQNVDSGLYVHPGLKSFSSLCEEKNYKLDYSGEELDNIGLWCTTDSDLKSFWSSSSIEVIAVPISDGLLAEGILLEAISQYSKGDPNLDGKIYSTVDGTLELIDPDEAIFTPCSGPLLCAFSGNNDRSKNLQDLLEENELEGQVLDCICVKEGEEASVLGRIEFSEEIDEGKKASIFSKAVARVSWLHDGEEKIRKSTGADDDGVFEVNGIDADVEVVVEVAAQDSLSLNTRKCYRGKTEVKISSGGNDIGTVELDEVLCSALYDWSGVPEVKKSTKEKKYDAANVHAEKIIIDASKTEAINYIKEEANRQGVPVDIALGIAWVESRMRQSVTSAAGAVGMMQIMPSTYADVSKRGICSGSDWRTNWKTNVDVGLCILRDKYSWAKNGINIEPYNEIDCNKGLTGWTAAVRAYNGLNCNAKYGDRDYVTKVLSAAKGFAHLA